MQYFLQVFTNNFQILRYGDYVQDLELINLSWLGLNFHGHRGSLCFKINFVYIIFQPLLRSNIVFMNYVHSVYTFETCHTIEEKKSGPSWLTLFCNKIYTCDSIENKWIIIIYWFIERIYQQSSSGMISEIF